MGFFSSFKKLWQGTPQEGGVATNDHVQDSADRPQDKMQDDLQEHEPSAPQDNQLDEQIADQLAEQVKEPQEALQEQAIDTEAARPKHHESQVDAQADWQSTLALRLREVEPRLSLWLDLTLENIERTGPLFDERVHFLLTTLGVSSEEANAFVDELKAWTTTMEYEYVEDFASELQYRLALALDLEDEHDERSRVLLQLQNGLVKTREQLSKNLNALLSSHTEFSRDFWEELEDIFIMADMGMATASQLITRLKWRVQKEGLTSLEDFPTLFAEELADLLKVPRKIQGVNPPEVILVIGVNGVGKTTTIAKLAYRAHLQGRKTMLAAADTFRAAAVEQLRVWAGRTGAGFHAKGQDADPAAVAFEAVDIAIAEKYDTLIIDTAGRLHTKANLMEELAKIRQVIAKKHPGAPHRTILIIDATTGQNAISQAKLFKEKAHIDEIILTKLDGTAKGGVALGIAAEHKLPISFIGLGEKMEDLRPFDEESFAKALLGK